MIVSVAAAAVLVVAGVVFLRVQREPWFRQWGDGPIPFADAQRDIVLALIYVDDSGEVRWARRV